MSQLVLTPRRHLADSQTSQPMFLDTERQTDRDRETDRQTERRYSVTE